ncbi:hypothetical protein GH714_016491 [Hevea brasiliensis]|uniref:NB-ARC domain-containing protein n=1 Tax=Hevea brasiliensis TaxID=3981 RepID=A0A6A6KSH5_HEVBR|nr:hypothetical protein GH714_016491 [Hevea brasiliensis]
MTETVLDLLKRAENFGDIAHPGTNLGSAFITEGIRDFRSRESIKNEVWEALKDDNLSMISICGTGGGQGYDYVKMHDIVRDVAISIASTDKQWHTLQSEAKMKEWREEDGYKHCIAISLLYEKISDQLNDLEYPKLELLQIWDDCWSPGLPNNVYAGMKELKVLALSSSFPSLLQSLDVLRNLRTLRLVVFKEYWDAPLELLSN